jgi:dolichol kinase
MDISSSELKRKAFHSLSILYLLLYAVFPRAIAVGVMTVALLAVGIAEFLRLRRPEVNAWFLKKFGGIHRAEEVMQLSGVFWMLLGCWLTMVVFASKAIVLPALGFVALGDTAASLGGKKWGKHPWPHNPHKTYEGSAFLALTAIAFALVFLRWPVAILGGLAAAWIEARLFPWRIRLWPFKKALVFPNDNLAVPVLSGLALSVLNLTIGKH